MKNFKKDLLIAHSKNLRFSYFAKMKKEWGFCYFLKDSSHIELVYDKEKNTFLKGPSYREKILVINPHSEISLQRHKFRKEKWHFKSNNIKILLGDNFQELNSYIFNNGDIIEIGKNMLHKIINPNNYHIFIYEEQMGICNEEDIKRYAEIQ